MTGWDLSCPDWRVRLAEGRSLVPVLPLNQKAADRAVAAFDKLRLPDVAGQPRMAEAAGDWFRDIVRALFGSIDDGGVRQIADIFTLVPKKNSKTTNGGGLMVTALIVNERPYARFGLFGPTQKIADIAFAAASGMIAADKGLTALFHVQDHIKTITSRLTKATLKVTTFDPSIATGGKYAGWLLDEAHLLSKVSHAARTLRQLRGARIAIPESFGVIITTQSDEPPAGAFREELQYARAVRDGTAPSAGLLPVLYEFPEEVQTDPRRPWLSPSMWKMVLPNVGRSVNVSILERDLVAERAKGEAALRIWASQHLNIEIGLALHSARWRGADHWEKAHERGLTLDEILARSEVVTVGIDGGGLDDLLGLAVIGREKVTKRWLHWGHAWADRGVLDLRPEIAAVLQDHEKDGDLTFVDIAPPEGVTEPGLVVNEDIADLVAIVKRIHDAGLLPEKEAIGLDPVGVAAIVDGLVDAEISRDRLCGIPQGYKLSGIIAGTARKLKDGSLVHCGQRLMAWCVGNAKAEMRGSALLVTKETAGKAKIDPLAALFDAADLMSRNPEAAGRGIDDYFDHLRAST